MKIYQSYLIKKYGIENVKNKKYQDLIKEILNNNQKNIVNSVIKTESMHWINAIRKIKDKSKQFVIPDFSSVLDAKKRSIFAIKSAEKGKIINQTLKDKISNDIRTVLDGYREKPGFLKKIISHGKEKGVINPEIINKLESNLKITFENYVKIDPKYGVPSNIHNIAVTETRSIINNTKKEYANELQKKNPHVIIMKIWRHNKSLSKEPRPGHKEINNTKIEFSQKFKIPVYVKKKKQWLFSHFSFLDHPHDSQANAEDVIGCNCDLIFETQSIHMPSTTEIKIKQIESDIESLEARFKNL